MKLFFFTLFSLYIIPLHAQFFSVRKNNAFIKAGLTYVSADGFFDNDGEIQNLLDYRTTSVFLQAEYGISNRLNAFMKAPVYTSSSADFEFAGQGSTTVSASSMGDVTIGMLYHFFSGKPWELSLAAMAELPSGIHDNIYGLNTGYGILSPGARLKGRYSLNPSLYVNAYAGFFKRTNGFTDEIRSGGEAGYKLLSRLWTILHFHGIDPLENGDDKKTGGLPGLYHNNSGYLKTGLEINYSIKQAALFLAGYYPLKGQFVQGAPDFQAGLIYIFAGGKEE